MLVFCLFIVRTSGYFAVAWSQSTTRFEYELAMHVMACRPVHSTCILNTNLFCRPVFFFIHLAIFSFTSMHVCTLVPPANVKYCVTGLEEAVERVAAEKDWSWLRIVPILRKCKASPYVKSAGEVNDTSFCTCGRPLVFLSFMLLFTAPL